MKKRILASVISAVLLLQVFSFTAFAAGIEGSVSLDNAANEVTVFAEGLEPNSQVSLMGFIDEVDLTLEKVDYLNQYVADENGELSESYPSSAVWAGGEEVFVLVNGVELPSAIVIPSGTITVGSSAAGQVVNVDLAYLGAEKELLISCSYDDNSGGDLFDDGTEVYTTEADGTLAFSYSSGANWDNGGKIIIWVRNADESPIKGFEEGIFSKDITEVVYAESIKIVGVSLLTVKVNTTGKLTAVVDDNANAFGNATWTSSNTSVLKVNNTAAGANYVALKSGVAIVTATCKAGAGVVPATSSITIRVTP